MTTGISVSHRGNGAMNICLQTVQPTEKDVRCYWREERRLRGRVLFLRRSLIFSFPLLQAYCIDVPCWVLLCNLSPRSNLSLKQRHILTEIVYCFEKIWGKILFLCKCKLGRGQVCKSGLSHCVLSTQLVLIIRVTHLFLNDVWRHRDRCHLSSL